MRRLIPLFILLGLTCIVYSGEIEVATLDHLDGEYQVNLSVKVNGDQATIYRIATDYDQLSRLSDIIIESGLIEREDQAGNKIVRRKLLTKTCVAFFCFVATLVEDVSTPTDGIIRTVIIPEMSNFIYGDAEWQILEVSKTQTLINFNSRFKPDFWIPPVIGPLFIKKMVLNKTRQTIENIERLAASE